MSNKLNLIIDFNNIAFRSLFTCTYASEYEASTFDTDKECEILIRKIAMDMSYVIRMFSPNRIIVACDAKNPWRNSLYDNIPDMTYKGNRVKDESKNWDKIFAAFSDLKSILESKGIIISEIINAEADDLAALWKEKLKESGESAVFVTSDRDWSQLIDFDKASEQFFISFNPISNNRGMKCLYVTEEFDTWLNDTGECHDIFFGSYNSMKSKLRDTLKQAAKISVEIVSPDNILLDKIICGDDGDNVPGFYDFYKNGKKWRMTSLRTRKCMESAGLSLLSDFRDPDNIIKFTEEIGKLAKHEIDDMDPIVRFNRQRRLVELDTSLFPDTIKNSFDKHYKKVSSIAGAVSANKMEDLLSGSKYVDENYKKTKDNSIFTELKNLDYLIVKNSALF